MDGTDLKHLGETSPALAEFRSHRQQQWSGSPSQLLDAMGASVNHTVPPQTTAMISTPSERTVPPPQQGSTNTSTPDSSLARALYAPGPSSSSTLSIKTSLQLQGATPQMKGGQSAPAKLHASHHHHTPKSEVNTKNSDTDITTALRCTAGRNTGKGHPLVTSTKPDCSGSNCNRQGHTSGCPKPSGQGYSSSCPKSSGQGMSGESNPSHASASPAPGSNTNPQSDDCETDGKPAPSACSSEEARKLRQAQQKLQKEKWQRKYGLGSKRHSEGSVGGESFPEQAPHNKGQTADEGCFNELISDGKALLCLHCMVWSTQCTVFVLQVTRPVSLSLRLNVKYMEHSVFRLAYSAITVLY